MGCDRGDVGKNVEEGQGTWEVDTLRLEGEQAKDDRGRGVDGGRGMSGDGGRGVDVGGREDRRQDTVSDTLLVLSNGDIKHGDAGGRERGTKVWGFVIIVRRVTIVGIIRHLATVSTMRDCPSVRNSLSTRSSLDWGGVTWVLKAEIGCKDDKSDEECNDDGLYCQCCGVLSIP